MINEFYDCGVLYIAFLSAFILIDNFWFYSGFRRYVHFGLQFSENLPSHVLLALGLSPQPVSQTIRLSLWSFTREQGIERAADSIRACLVQPAFWAVAQAR